MAKGGLGARLAWLCRLFALAFTTKVSVNLEGCVGTLVIRDVFCLNGVCTLSSLGRGSRVKFFGA